MDTREGDNKTKRSRAGEAIEDVTQLMTGGEAASHGPLIETEITCEPRCVSLSAYVCVSVACVCVHPQQRESDDGRAEGDEKGMEIVMQSHLTPRQLRSRTLLLPESHFASATSFPPFFGCRFFTSIYSHFCVHGCLSEAERVCVCVLLLTTTMRSETTVPRVLCRTRPSASSKRLGVRE